MANKHGMQFFETSAEDKRNVEKVFASVTAYAARNAKASSTHTVDTLIKDERAF